MRIGIFSDSYKPYISGVVRSIETLRQGIQRAGHQVYVFGPQYPVTTEDEEGHILRFPSISVPFYPQFRIPLPYRRQIRAAARRVGLDVVHTHTPFIMGAMAADVARALDIPLCLTFHTRYDVYLRHYAPAAGAVLTPLLNDYLRRFCNRCQLVVAPTRAIGRMLVEMGVRTPIEVIPSGVSWSRLGDADPAHVLRVRARLGIPREAPVFLYTGRLSREKNLPLLLDAFRRLAGRYPDIHLILVGDGPLRPNLAKRVAAWGLTRQVHLVGAVQPDQIAFYYQAADIYVFPSVTETQGLAVVEAMAAGLPVVAVFSHVLAEVVRDGQEGILTEATAEGLAAGCQRLLDAPSVRQRMGKAARAAARAYDSESVLTRMLDLYHQLVSSGQRSGTPSSALP